LWLVPVTGSFSTDQGGSTFSMAAKRRKMSQENIFEPFAHFCGYGFVDFP
jgi:hypothetical protein